MLTKYKWDVIESEIDLSENEKEALKTLYELQGNYSASLTIQLQSIFLKMSIQRMKQLSNKQKLPEMSVNYFKTNDLQYAWNKIRQDYNCSLNEFKTASDFNKLNALIYERDLKDSEKEEMVESFKYLFNIYISNFNDHDSISQIEKQENEEIMQGESIPPIRKVGNNKTEDNIDSLTFIDQLSRLQMSSVEAVVHEKEFTQLQRYMHVDRDIQDELIQALSSTDNKTEPKLILLCGSVGDGKSHLLSYIKENHGELLENCLVHNDSTESFNPEEEDVETLERVLSDFEIFEEASVTTVIAINLGVLHKFYTRQKEKGRFQTFCKYIENSKVFSHQTPKHIEGNNFHLLNFAGLQPYEITDTGAKSPFFKSIIQKVVNPNEDNPFYNTWKRDKAEGINSAAHENYILLQDETIQDSVVQKLIEAMIQEKLFLSTRALYNFIYDIIVPLNSKTEFLPNHALPFMLFNRPDRSDLMQALHDIDPILQRDEKIDNIISSFILSSEPLDYLKKLLGETFELSSVWKNYEQDADTDYLKLLVRSYALLNQTDQDRMYQSFLRLLFAYYTGDENKMSELFDMLDTIMEQWIGSPEKGYLYMDTNNSSYRIAVKFEGEPEIDEKLFGSRSKSAIQHFTPEIKIGYRIGDESILVAIDYKLYKLLSKVANGYCPNQQDYTEALQFTDFYSQIIRESDQSKELLIVHRDSGKRLKFTKPRFSKKDYEVEVY